MMSDLATSLGLQQKSKAKKRKNVEKKKEGFRCMVKTLQKGRKKMRYFLSKVGLGVDDQTATEELETGSTQRYFKWKTGDEKALMTYTGDIGMGGSEDYMVPDNTEGHSVSPGSLLVETSGTVDVTSQLRAKLTDAGTIGVKSNVSDIDEDNSDQCEAEGIERLDVEGGSKVVHAGEQDVTSEVEVEVADTGERGVAGIAANMGIDQAGQDETGDMQWSDAGQGLDEPVHLSGTVDTGVIMGHDVEEENGRQQSSDDTIIYEVQTSILKKTTNMSAEKGGQPKRDGTQPHSRARVVCQECLKNTAVIPDQPTEEERQKSTLAKSRYNIERHFRKYHIGLPIEEQKEIIEDMCCRKRRVQFQIPIEHIDTGAKTSETVQQLSSERGISALVTHKKQGRKPDTRKRKREAECIFCKVIYSDQHLRKGHLMPYSKGQCRKMTEAYKKKYSRALHLATLGKCRKISVKEKTISRRMAEQSQPELFMTATQLADRCEKWNRGLQGKCNVPPELIIKVRKGEELLTLQEKRLWRKARVVRNQQLRVLFPLYGDNPFHLQQIQRVTEWMGDEDKTVAFYASRKHGTAPLKHMTIATLARSLLHLLDYIEIHFTDPETLAASTRARKAVKAIERSTSKVDRTEAGRRLITEIETAMVPIEEIEEYVSSVKVAETVNKITSQGWKENVLKLSEKELWLVQCHVAFDVTLHSGKRPMVLQSLTLRDVRSAMRHGTPIRNKEGNLEYKDCTYTITVVPESNFARFKTQAAVIIAVSLQVYRMMWNFAQIREKIQGAQPNDTLFTTQSGGPCYTMNEHIRTAWAEAGLTSNISSTMLRHTIVTMGRRRDLDERDLRTLAMGMDHSLRIARERYAHDHAHEAVNFRHVIQRLLKSNSWEQDVNEGLIDDMELEVEEERAVLIESPSRESEEGLRSQEEEQGKELSQEQDEEEDHSAERFGRPALFSNYHTGLIERLFTPYINSCLDDMQKVVRKEHIWEVWMTEMNEGGPKSRFRLLEKYSKSQIIEKVRAIVRKERHRKIQEEKMEEKRKEKQRQKEKADEKARQKAAKSGGSSKGKVKTVKTSKSH